MVGLKAFGGCARVSGIDAPQAQTLTKSPTLQNGDGIIVMLILYLISICGKEY